MEVFNKKIYKQERTKLYITVLLSTKLQIKPYKILYYEDKTKIKYPKNSV